MSSDTVTRLDPEALSRRELWERISEDLASAGSAAAEKDVDGLERAVAACQAWIDRLASVPPADRQSAELELRQARRLAEGYAKLLETIQRRLEEIRSELAASEQQRLALQGYRRSLQPLPSARFVDDQR